ncbi:MAG: stage II sporulation protein M [Pseudomonadota bacterium]
MRQGPFETQHEALWEEFDEVLARADEERAYRLPPLYQEVCHHYALARSRHYSPYLVAKLHDRVQEGHAVLYRYRSASIWAVLRFLWVDFPDSVRRNHLLVAIAAFCFFVPLFAMGIATYMDTELVYSVHNPSDVAAMEYAYEPNRENYGRGTEDENRSNFAMFGFYIYNNISVGFRCFASGLVFGIGSVAMLVFNGVAIGSIAGHLTQLGYSETFYPFVSGHGAFELPAIVICGAAGLRLAKPLIARGRYSLGDALRVAGRDSVKLVMGATCLFTIAAFIEAFWSPSDIAPVIRLSVAVLLWVLALGYFVSAGRRHVPGEHRGD